MISFAIAKTLFSGKLGHLVLWTLPVFTGIVITEAFLGQMIGALIAATPPTIAIIMLSRRQSEERRIAQEALLQGQRKMAEDLDGKLDRLSKAETGQALAEGKLEGAATEQARAAAATPEVKADPDSVQKMQIVNDEDNAVPTRSVEPKPDAAKEAK